VNKFLLVNSGPSGSALTYSELACYRECIGIDSFALTISLEGLYKRDDVLITSSGSYVIVYICLSVNTITRKLMKYL